MRIAARVLAGIVALLFLIFGIRFMFTAEASLVSTGLTAATDLGLATWRAFAGAGFLTFGILLVMHSVIHQETGALRFTILFLLLSIIGRVIGLIAEGSSPEALRNLVPVALLFIGSVASLVMFLRSEPAS